MYYLKLYIIVRMSTFVYTCVRTVSRDVFIAFYFADVDECANQLHNCDEHAACSDTEDGFICTCLSGYTGNGSFCSGRKLCEFCCILTDLV